MCKFQRHKGGFTSGIARQFFIGSAPQQKGSFITAACRGLWDPWCVSYYLAWRSRLENPRLPFKEEFIFSQYPFLIALGYFFSSHHCGGTTTRKGFLLRRCFCARLDLRRLLRAKSGAVATSSLYLPLASLFCGRPASRTADREKERTTKDEAALRGEGKMIHAASRFAAV